jgi:hypothetical protein
LWLRIKISLIEVKEFAYFCMYESQD